MAPLIDVTFILLIFFMLVTQYTRFAPVDVTLGEIVENQPPQQEAAGAKQEAQTKLTLRADGTLELDGTVVPSVARLPQMLADKLQQISQAVAASPELADQPPVLLVSPESDVHLQFLIDALSALEQAPMFEARIAIPKPESDQ